MVEAHTTRKTAELGTMTTMVPSHRTLTIKMMFYNSNSLDSPRSFPHILGNMTMFPMNFEPNVEPFVLQHLCCGHWEITLHLQVHLHGHVSRTKIVFFNLGVLWTEATSGKAAKQLLNKLTPNGQCSFYRFSFCCPAVQKKWKRTAFLL